MGSDVDALSHCSASKSSRIAGEEWRRIVASDTKADPILCRTASGGVPSSSCFSFFATSSSEVLTNTNCPPSFAADRGRALPHVESVFWDIADNLGLGRNMENLGCAALSLQALRLSVYQTNIPTNKRRAEQATTAPTSNPMFAP